MGNERLSSLAMLHVHRAIDINIENVIDMFAKMKNWNRNFIL